MGCWITKLEEGGGGGGGGGLIKVGVGVITFGLTLENAGSVAWVVELKKSFSG